MIFKVFQDKNFANPTYNLLNCNLLMASDSTLYNVLEHY